MAADYKTASAAGSAKAESPTPRKDRTQPTPRLAAALAAHERVRKQQFDALVAETARQKQQILELRAALAKSVRRLRELENLSHAAGDTPAARRPPAAKTASSGRLRGAESEEAIEAKPEAGNP
jgi:hypothetical protein